MAEEVSDKPSMECEKCGGRLGDCECAFNAAEGRADEGRDAPKDESPLDGLGAGTEEPDDPDRDTLADLDEDAASAKDKVARAETQDETPPPLAADPSETVADAKFRRQMRELGKQPNVALFGYRTAGKSWLLHRLKHHLFEDLGADLDPDFETVAEHGQVLPGTSEIEFHDIVTAPPWTIIDTPGEFTRQLVAGKVEEMWQLVKVLDRATSIIITLPADTLVFGPQVDAKRILSDNDRWKIAAEACGLNPDTEDEDEAARIEEIDEFISELRDDYLDIDRFAKGLFRAAATLSYVRHHKIDALDPKAYKDVTWSKVKRHCGDPRSFQPIGGPNGLDCPVFIALTKADRVVSVLYGDQEIGGAGEMINTRKADMLEWDKTKALQILAKRSGVLNDPEKYPLSRPSEFVRALAPALHTRLVKFCPMSRFDFVSAFFGHDYSNTLQFGHYDLCPQFGVDHMYQWIKSALGLSGKSQKRRMRQALARRLHFSIHGIPKPGDSALKGGD